MIKASPFFYSWTPFFPLLDTKTVFAFITFQRAEIWQDMMALIFVTASLFCAKCVSSKFPMKIPQIICFGSWLVPEPVFVVDLTTFFHHLYYLFKNLMKRSVQAFFKCFRGHSDSLLFWQPGRLISVNQIASTSGHQKPLLPIFLFGFLM